jgi:hypothetical protein
VGSCGEGEGYAAVRLLVDGCCGLMTGGAGHVPLNWRAGMAAAVIAPCKKGLGVGRRSRTSAACQRRAQPAHMPLET